MIILKPKATLTPHSINRHALSFLNPSSQAESRDRRYNFEDQTLQLAV